MKKKHSFLTLFLLAVIVLQCRSLFAAGGLPKACINAYQNLYDYSGCDSIEACQPFEIILETLGYLCTVSGTSSPPPSINTSLSMLLIARNEEGTEEDFDSLTLDEGLLYFGRLVGENTLEGLTDFRLRYYNPSGEVQEVPVHFSSFLLNGASLPSRPIPDPCADVSCTGGSSCVAGSCECPEGQEWSIGSEQCVDEEVCDAEPAICAGTHVAGGGSGTPSGTDEEDPTPEPAAGAAGGCTRIASRGASPSSLAWLGLLLLAAALRRLRRADRVEDLRDRS